MVQIGSLQVSFDQRNIQRNGVSLRIGARAFDILDVLYRANGAILSKDQIMDAVWPGLIVEENRLQVHIASLRKLLGAERDLIKTVPGRGYVLVAQRTPAVEAPAHTEPAPQHAAAPPLVSPLIGRQTEIEQVIAQLEREPVTTVVGAGGIGKTALALHVASEMHSRYGLPTCFVELANASSHEEVLAALAHALAPRVDDAQPGADAVADALAASRCLLVLDNAEHVIDIVAGLVETLAARSPSARILVTSREALHIRAESVLRLEALGAPASGLSTQALLAHPAVELFLCHARAFATDCATDESSIALVAEICRRLDGLPLAIELAAARVATLGVEGVAARLDHRLDLLAGRSRSAVPRHQSLRATFEWSYALLDTASRVLYRRLGCFTGTFTFDAVCAVGTEPGMSIPVIVSGLGDLATKSLLNVEFHGPIATYRLTECARAYALDKLRDEGELHVISARHMRYMQTRIEESGLVLAHDARAGAEIPARFSLEDARTAYEWAFSDDGDPAQGVALAGALVGTLLDASLVRECCERAKRALAVLDTLPAGSVDIVCEMRLCTAYASTLMHAGDDIERAMSLWQRVWRLAQSAQDDAFAARALCGLWNAALATADVHASIRYATRFEQAARRAEPRWHEPLAGAMVAVSLHAFGEHEQARERLENAVAVLGEAGCTERSCATLDVDPLVFCHGALARIAWLEGKPARAMQLIEQALSHARGEMPEPSLSQLLATVAVPVALQCGDMQAASRYLALLRSQVATHRFAIWEDYAECLAVQCGLRDGDRDSAAALARLEPALLRLVARGIRGAMAPFIVSWAELLVEAGRFEAAAARLDEAISLGETHGEQCFLPELMRARGWVALQRARVQDGAGPDVRGWHEADGRRFLCGAIAVAGEHGAVIWRLRATVDLAEHLIDRDEARQAAALIAGIDKEFDLDSSVPDVQRLGRLRRRLSSERSVRARAAHSA
ncbi:winged helix-turn-helix domain-containing protein [Paraburkholderia pallida]|uniref:Transcriptional regulator n=1 Tax=Paraburkholderia pallida TaxID=2547399 RepID=A0A4P7D5U6_9BURK|nr:winged helix-turn-helix domain-containing protein [Paraburkholderia pallida]QBR01994.1 transcriptional regulator [Paraburkholderia pallida]